MSNQVITRGGKPSTDKPKAAGGIGTPPIQEDRTARLNLTIRPSLLRRFKIQAAMEEKKLTDLAEEILENYLESTSS